MQKKFLAAAILFVTLVTLKLHGFSWGMWSSYVGGDAATEFQIGSPQGSRSDDWAAVLPMTFAQIAHQPSFPTINKNYGYPSATVRAEFPMPSRAWETLFRPHLWGYFLGGDVGMAWEWWFRILALVLSAMLVAEALLGCDAWTAFALAAAFATAPFFSFWSYNLEPCASTALLILYTLNRLSDATNWRQSFKFGALLTYLGLMLAFGISYPAYQIQFVWLSLITATVFAFRVQAGQRLRYITSLATAAIVAGTCVALYAWQNLDALKVVLGTVYPGARDLRGGELTLVRLFLNNLVVFSKTSVNWAQFGSVAEGSGFLHLFPISMALLLWNWKQQPNNAKRPLLAIATLFTLLIVSWGLFTWPALLAKATLLNRIPGQRLMIGLGVVEFLWLALICSKNVQISKQSKAIVILLAAFMILGLSLWGQSIAPDTILLRRWIPASIFVIALTWLLMTRPRLIPWTLLVVNLATTVRFNPLVRGGYEKLRQSRIVQALIKEQIQNPQARWAVLGNGILANLPRAYGVPCINGIHFAPAWPLWKQLDPQGQEAAIYNRYAYVGLSWPVSLGEFAITSPYPDMVTLNLHPDDPRFLALNIDHLWITHADAPPKFQNWELIGEPAPGHHFFRKRAAR